MLFDHVTHYEETKEPAIEYVDGGSAKRKFYHWQKTVKMTSGKSSQRSFNFNRPLETIKSQINTVAHQDASQKHERYIYPGLNNEPQGSDLDSRIQMERIENTHTQVRVSTSCRSLEPGHTFSFDRHVIERECEFDYVVTTIDYVAIDDTYLNQSEGESSQVLESHLSCIPKHVLFRRTKQYPRPVVTGTQTAIVCGKAGEEIHTDELGRIRIQFHWDRIGERDENSTCWVRVAQPWAHSGFGGQYIPRIGQEVLVHFEEGDINKPLVQGAVYNGRNKPAFDLPANKTQSGSKTRSSKGADPVQYNEIRFEDKKGEEHLHVQAQKDQRTVVKDSDTRAIGNEQLLSVGKSKFEVIGKNRDTVINEGNDKLQAQGDIGMQSVSGGVVFEAKHNIEFEVGGSKIFMGGAGHLLLNSSTLNIDGSSKVNINCGNEPLPKRLSPKKVSDIFTTPTAGGTAVRDISISVEKQKELAKVAEHQSSRAKVKMEDYKLSGAKESVGLRSSEVMERFICQSKALYDGKYDGLGPWAGLDDKKKLQALKGIANQALSESGVPPVGVVSKNLTSENTVGQFSLVKWELALEEKSVIDAKTPDEFKAAIGTVYHESAHAEQNWLAALYAKTIEQQADNKILELIKSGSNKPLNKYIKSLPLYGLNDDIKTKAFDLMKKVPLDSSGESYSLGKKFYKTHYGKNREKTQQIYDNLSATDKLFAAAKKKHESKVNKLEQQYLSTINGIKQPIIPPGSTKNDIVKIQRDHSVVVTETVGEAVALRQKGIDDADKELDKAKRKFGVRKADKRYRKLPTEDDSFDLEDEMSSKWDTVDCSKVDCCSGHGATPGAAPTPTQRLKPKQLADATNNEKAKALISDGVKNLVSEFGGHLKNANVADLANTFNAENLMSGAINALSSTASGGQFVSVYKIH